MSAIAPGLIRCDNTSCRRYYSGTGSNARTIYGTRSEARTDGWAQNITEDYCPTHKGKEC